MAESGRRPTLVEEPWVFEVLQVAHPTSASAWLGERGKQEVTSSLTHAMRDKPVTTTTALITDVAYWRSRLQTVSELIYISTAIITCKQ